MLTGEQVTIASDSMRALKPTVSGALAACLLYGHFELLQAQPTVNLSGLEADRNGTGMRFVSLQTLPETNPSEISLSEL